MFADWVDVVRESMAACRRLTRGAFKAGIASGDIQEVHRGTHVESACLELADSRWQRREISLTAGLLAMDRAARRPLFVAGPAATFIHGLPAGECTLTIEILVDYRPPAQPSRRMRQLRWADGKNPPRVAVIRRQRPRALAAFEEHHGLITLPRDQNLLWIAGRHEPATGFVALCGALAEDVRFNRDDAEGSRAREHTAKDALRSLIGMQQGCLERPAQARWLIDNADSGCESPGESMMLFPLRAGGVQNVVTQPRIQTRSGVRYPDLKIDGGANVFGEYEGEAKDGDTVDDVQRAQHARDRRYKELEALGWVTVPVRKRDLPFPNRVLADFHKAARAPLIVVPALGLPGWAPEDLDRLGR